MSFVKSKGFKYLKNFIIGVGAALVMLGALYKIQSWPMPSIGDMKVDLLSVGLITEAILFLFLGIIGPDKDYYWEKLYPGLDNYNGNVAALTPGGDAALSAPDPQAAQETMNGMLTELQGMSKSLGSLKALQEVDFSQTGDQIKTMGNFYTKMNEAMASLNNTVDDTKLYQEQLSSLNRNISSLNGVYGNVLTAFKGN